MCWHCKEVLKDWIRQEHILEGHVQNLVDAQQMFSSDRDNLMPLSQVIEDVRHEMQQSGLKPEGHEWSSKGSGKNGRSGPIASDWTEEDWDRLQVLLRPPDWDRFHAYNERAVRRPFSQAFLKHGAATILAMQAVPKQENGKASFTYLSFHLFKSFCSKTIILLTR